MVSKMLIFENYLPLKEPLTVTVGEARAQTSRKCAVVQSVNLLKSSKNTDYFGCTYPFSL